MTRHAPRLAVAALTAGLSGAGAAAAERAACLVHAGPQDKPMLAICFGPAEAGAAPDPLRLVLPRTGAAGALFAALIDGVRDGGGCPAGGTYRLDGTPIHVCGPRFRAFVADLAAATGEVPLQELARRLP